jgi:hypothetical protein
MQGIAINGTMLHEVRMLMEPYQQGAISYLSYPKSRINFKIDGPKIQLSFPAMLAVELYRTGILPQNANATFPVSISGKKIGHYRVLDFRYPGLYSRPADDVTMVLSSAIDA